jgi:hypothetical protein
VVIKIQNSPEGIFAMQQVLRLRNSLSNKKIDIKRTA